MISGIDVSEWQGNIDWKRVKTGFAVLRAGYGRLSSQIDKCFIANYEGCKENNIPCGAYWYSYAESPDDARQEAVACLDVIKNRQFEYPIYYDVEERSILDSGKSAVSAIIRSFIDTLEQSGYFAGLYMSLDILNAYTDDEIRRKYALWTAYYSSQKPSVGSMWQKSSAGRIDGIQGNVDIDESFEDYPEIIRKAGLNGFGRQHTISVEIDGEIIIKDYRF
ncbi:MAG: glycoside hydrolase family 25 protein [Ruminococcus sp.]|nr:glycoside hydrolase family 25 protein [Ruminococcus sp.]